MVMPNLSALEWPFNPSCFLSPNSSPDALAADIHPGQCGQVSPTPLSLSCRLLSLKSLQKLACISKVQNEKKLRPISIAVPERPIPYVPISQVGVKYFD